MREHVITSAAFFQSALYANSRDMMPELSETLLLLSTGKTSLWTLQPESSRRGFRPLESQTLSRPQRRESLSVEVSISGYPINSRH